MKTRAEAVEALVSTGKTREQAEAFLDLLGSGLRRRGWIEGDPLTQDEISERLETFIGDAPFPNERTDPR